MHRKINIHIDNWVILLGNAVHNIETNYKKIICDASEFEQVIEQVVNQGINIFIETTDASKFILDASQAIKYSVACGGYVQNAQLEILFIYRRQKWDLPKGKLDKGETLAQCAIREVQEETGAQDITLGNLRNETFHVFKPNEKYILKHTYWYNMQCSDATFTPQAEEDIEIVKWVNAIDVAMCLQNSFKSIEEVVYASTPT